jgi:hypothetical protein
MQVVQGNNGSTSPRMRLKVMARQILDREHQFRDRYVTPRVRGVTLGWTAQYSIPAYRIALVFLKNDISKPLHLLTCPSCRFCRI